LREAALALTWQQAGAHVRRQLMDPTGFCWLSTSRNMGHDMTRPTRDWASTSRRANGAQGLGELTLTNEPPCQGIRIWRQVNGA